LPIAAFGTFGELMTDANFKRINPMKISFARFKLLAAVALNFFGGAVFAVANAALPRINVSSDQDINNIIICGVAAFMFQALMAVSVVMVVIAAYKYLTSGGDPNKVSSATKTITYAAVAIVVALVAKSFAPIVSSMVGGISAGNATGAAPPGCP
jgi:hypothetical protein